MRQETLERIRKEWKDSLNSNPEWIGYFDGACPDGNNREPGRTRFGAILYQSGEIKWQGYGYAGIGTVNTAEYSGLIELLEAAIDHQVASLVICGDSQLVILQMQGHYRVKAVGLRSFHQTARELAGSLPEVKFAWIPREQNTVADKLSKKTK